MAVKWNDIIAGLPVVINAAIEEAIGSASRDTAEALNQAVRRIATTSNVSDALTALVDSTSPFCSVAAILTLQDDGHARAAASRGTSFSGESFAIASAPALSSLLESREPVTSEATPGELSPSLAQALASPDSRAYLFPLKVRNRVVAALAAAGEVRAGAVECLCESASIKLEILLPPPPPPVQAPAVKEPKREAGAWDTLSPEAQRSHLQAQRFSRVKVAELRLYHADAVREGRAKSDLYGALRSNIDELRKEFQKDFVPVATMVDYLHLELLRSLAHDDDRLLGADYPGPLI